MTKREIQERTHNIEKIIEYAKKIKFRVDR